MSKWDDKLISDLKQDDIPWISVYIRIEKIDRLLKSALNHVDDENLYDEIRRFINGE